VGGMPENVLKSISKQILKALCDIHTKLRTSHGVICPSQVLLERNGNVKVRIFIPSFFVKKTIAFFGTCE